MEPLAISQRSAARTGSVPMGTLPDPLPKPPGRAPGEPIIIKNPPRPAEAPEIDRPTEEEDDPEMEQPPEIVPERPPPPAPWERAHPHAHGGGDERGGRERSRGRAGPPRALVAPQRSGGAPDGSGVLPVP